MTSPGEACARALALSVFMTAASGCLFFTTERSQCETDAECRQSFGFGATCGSRGFCEAARVVERCTRTFPSRLLSDRDEHRDFIPIGAVFQRGPDVFANMENAARLALKHANDQGGVDGRKFGLVMCRADPEIGDSLTGTDAAVEVARYLVDEIGAPAIIGPATSDNTQAVFQAVQDDDVLVLSPSATSAALSDLDPEDVSDESPGLLWRTAAPDSIQGLAMASDMREPGVGRAQAVSKTAVIHITGPYGGGLADTFASEFMKQGGQVELFPFENDGERDAGITDAPNTSGVEEILFISNDVEDIKDFLDTSAGLQSYDGKGIFLSEAAAAQSVIGEVDPTRLPQVRGTRPQPLNFSSDLVYQRFIVSYQAEYDVERDVILNSVFSANAYDAGFLAAYGATWALFQEEGELGGTTMARGLRKISGGDRVEIGPSSWVTVQQQFEAGNDIDVQGASGPLDYSPETEETSIPIEVWAVDGDMIDPQYEFTPPP